jgi:hypothetical protein
LLDGVRVHSDSRVHLTDAVVERLAAGREARLSRTVY